MFVLLDFALAIKKKITEAGAYIGKESIDYESSSSFDILGIINNRERMISTTEEKSNMINFNILEY